MAIIEVQGNSMVGVLGKYARVWCDTSTISVFPLSGTDLKSRHGSGSRKPDAVLMKQDDRSKVLQWANFISVMEIKYHYNLKFNNDTTSYMGEVACLS